MAYDTVSGAWTLFEPPTSHDWPRTLGNLAAMPSLGEAWLVGHVFSGEDLSTEHPIYRQWALDNNVHVNMANAGRRIVRFKVA